MAVRGNVVSSLAPKIFIVDVDGEDNYDDRGGSDEEVLIFRQTDGQKDNNDVGDGST